VLVGLGLHELLLRWPLLAPVVVGWRAVSAVHGLEAGQ
jgi:hypothetical protein